MMNEFYADFGINPVDPWPIIEVVPQNMVPYLLNPTYGAYRIVNEKAKPGIEGCQLHLTNSKGNYHVRVNVLDNGKGIFVSIKERLFRPIFSTKPMGFTGSGPGLSYDIVKAHGRELRVNSQETSGLGFSLTRDEV